MWDLLEEFPRGDYKPVNNNVVLNLLNSVRNVDNSTLEDFVRRELTPKSLQKTGSSELSDEQKVIFDALHLCIEEYGDSRRKNGVNLNSKHAIDTARILVQYDFDSTLDYITVGAALLHDIIEDTDLDKFGVAGYFDTTTLKKVSDEAKIHDDIVKLICTVETLTWVNEDYDEYLGKIFLGDNDRAKKIKLADKIAQSFELDERQFFANVDKVRDWARHFLVYLFGGRSVENNGKTRTPLLPKIYLALSPFKLESHLTSTSAYKAFRCIDFACQNINDEGNGNLVYLKNLLIYSALSRIVEPRKRHLVEAGHISKRDVRRIIKDVEEYEKSGDLYRLTPPNKENDIFMGIYRPTSLGDKLPLKNSTESKEVQFRHLELFRKLINRYAQDMFKYRENPNSTLFTFNWKLEKNPT